MLKRLTFQPRFGLAALILFVILTAIALWVRDSFVRPFLGDVLAVIWLYLLARTFIKANPSLLAALTLAFAFALETAQYFSLIKHLGLEHVKLARVILGATFDWFDLLAYLMGWFVIMASIWITDMQDTAKDTS